MITVNIPERFDDLQDETLLTRLFDLLNIDRTTATNTQTQRRHGRYIKITHDDAVYFVCIAAREVTTRNAYVLQYLGPTYSDFVSDPSHNKKLFVYYPHSFGGDQTIAPYHIFANRIIQTIGAEILNEAEAFQGKLSQPFRSFEELQDVRDRQRATSKTRNKSSYVTRNTDGSIEIYGKTYGANMEETIIIVAAVARLAGSAPVTLFPVTDHATTTHTASSLEIFRQLGVHVEGSLQIEPDKEETLKDIRSSGSVRNTARFHYNLLRKFGPKKCYLCDCSIDTAIIGAHIHRVTDIGSDDSLSMDEKLLQAADGDNGLWLCATHDKLYEYGLIYFGEDYKLYVATQLSDTQKRYVDDLTTNKSFYAEHESPETTYYLEKHRQRVLA